MDRQYGCTRFLCAFSLGLALGACSGGGDDDDDAGSGGAGGGGGAHTPLDPDAPPVQEGDWYRPTASTTWQWQLLGEINPDYDVTVYDIDLFDASDSVISDLQDADRHVICYFSAGSFEDWRDDAGDFDSDAIGDPLDEWEGENWLDVRAPNVHQIMLARLDHAVERGCDGVEPDNVDGYANDTGFNLTYDDQLAFNRWLANEAHERGLTVGLKNSGDQVEDLLEYYDFELNEQCHEYDECDQLLPFVEADKPVWNAEYPGDEDAAGELSTTLCPVARSENIRTLILPDDLDDTWRVSCD